MPTKHSFIGGSVAKRILACPWSLANRAKAPVIPSSAAANEGTALHTLLELFYTDKIDSIESMVGQTIEGVTLDQDQIDRGLEASRALDEYLANLSEEVGEPCEIFYEGKVNFDTSIPGAFGTCDLIVKCGYVLAILDYKFGVNVLVDVEENAQLLFYAQGARRTMPQMAECTHVELSIIQPANTPTLQTWQTLPKRLDQFETDLIIAVEESKKEHPRCVLGDHCGWCPLESQCPEKQELATRALKASHKGINLEDLRFWLDNAKVIEKFLSANRDKALELLELGTPVEGWKLVNRRATRFWTDTEKVKDFAKSQNLSLEDISDTKLKTPAQLEKLITEELPEELVEKKSSGRTIAPTKDKRLDLNANNLSALKKFAKKS